MNLDFHRFDLPSRIRLSILPTKKLKTVLVKSYFAGNLDDSVTRKSLIPMLLRRGTRRLPDMQAIQRHLENLYGSAIATGGAKVGEWHILKFRLDAVNGRFLPGSEDVFGDSLRFLRELIFETHLENGSFPVTEVEQEKAMLARMIDALVDNKDQYALERLIQGMCSEEPFRRYEYGSKEEFGAVNAENLTEEWRDWSSRYPCQVYVAGDVEVSQTRELFEEVFSVVRPGGYVLDGIPTLLAAGKTRHTEETMDVQQSRLCLGYRNHTNYVEGDLEAQVLMNGVLGSFSHSKLFQNVREKASLAYDVHSFIEKTKGLLFIVSGIAAENYPRTLDIIKTQVRAIQEGDITDEEFESTRESIDNYLCMLEDSFSDLMEVDFVWNLHGRSFDLAAYRLSLRQVTKERIAAAARKLELDSVYLLKPRP